MAAGRMRSTRRLCSWIVEQVNSGKYPGLVWDDEAKTMFRIPWKHAGKQDFRKDEDAAIFKAWAEFKGKLTDGGQDNPASWKTRLRCALNKSPEFSEEMERAQLDISEPYKVYRLVPISEQGVVVPEKKCRVKATKRPKRRKSSDSESSDDSQPKQIKTEEVTSQLCVEEIVLWPDLPVQTEDPAQYAAPMQREVNEIRLDVRIEESVPAPVGVQDSFNVVIHYLGQEVLKRQVQSTDIRIMYSPPSPVPPPPAALKGRFPRIPLPEPPCTLPAVPELQALFTLLPFMEKGVVLTATPRGVYGKRFCQGRVFWTGPHTTTGLHKMERNTDPVMLFSKDCFKQQLDTFRVSGGEPPQCGITLCFGEELSHTEDPSGKLIIVQVNITFPWAEQQVQNVQNVQSVQSVFESISSLYTLASQSPEGEITLNLVAMPLPDSETITCGGSILSTFPGRDGEVFIPK
ncbi:interferon regulatory factor 9 isoform X2 [Etheostoma cragini]|uniref:interferon regulatory factor 9 isoform X2 n=1 Tax=Etheostoma cragini TaxID=417921 RepID=UPI00155F0A3D|nr:interferon regulatory factor 9 isoform X2 [Etheostoma cragini]